MILNINELVNMGFLTEKGRGIYDTFITSENWMMRSIDPCTPFMHTTKDELPLWQIMHIFGPDLYQGSKPIFVNNNLVCQKYITPKKYYVIYTETDQHTTFLTQKGDWTKIHSEAFILEDLYEASSELLGVGEKGSAYIEEICDLEEFKSRKVFSENVQEEFHLTSEEYYCVSKALWESVVIDDFVVFMDRDGPKNANR